MSNLKNISLLISVMLSMLLFACKQNTDMLERKTEMASPVSTGSTYWLFQNDIKALEEQANLGGKNAAFKLYQYYMFISFDQELEYKWLTVAAKNGHPVAQSNLAEVLLANDEKEKAVFWAKKAHENGAKLSNDLLNVIQ